MSTSDRDLGGEPPCLMASLDEEGNVTDARSPASTQVIARTDPPTVGPEKVMLEAFLDYHRATLLQKVSGVRDADLRRRLVPSLTTLLGLVKHLAYVERSWFQIVFAGEDLPVPWTKDDPDPDFRIALGETTEEILAFSGNRNGLDDATGTEITAEGLRRVARAAEDAGVTLVLELLNSKFDHQDYQGDRTAWGIKVCALVSSPRVKLLYDIYHMQIMEGDVIRTIRDSHAYFGHYHTAGNPGRHDLDEGQELYYPAIMRAILATGYDGYVSHEFIPRGDPLAALKAAFDHCNVTL